MSNQTTQKSEYTFFFLTVRGDDFWDSRHKRFTKQSLLQARATNRISIMCTQWDLSTLESLAFIQMPQRTYIFLKIIVLIPIGTVKKISGTVLVSDWNINSGESAPRQSHHWHDLDKWSWFMMVCRITTFGKRMGPCRLKSFSVAAKVHHLQQVSIVERGPASATIELVPSS